MVRAILFDLDDTLLRTHTQAFLARYFAAVGQYLSDIAEPEQIQRWIMQVTQRLLEREHPNETNVDVFGAEFEKLSGLSMVGLWPRFWRFYSDVFPTLGDGVEPMPFAREAVLEAQAAGFRVVVATNPLFPTVAIRCRLAWAGMGDVSFDLITALDNMHSAKPRPSYYREIAASIGVAEGACLMVGDDQEYDIEPAKAAGLWTYLVAEPGEGAKGEADDSGTMADFLAALRERRLPGMAAWGRPAS